MTGGFWPATYTGWKVQKLSCLSVRTNQSSPMVFERAIYWSLKFIPDRIATGTMAKITTSNAMTTEERGTNLSILPESVVSCLKYAAIREKVKGEYIKREESTANCIKREDPSFTLFSPAHKVSHLLPKEPDRDHSFSKSKCLRGFKPLAVKIKSKKIVFAVFSFFKNKHVVVKKLYALQWDSSSDV